MLAYSVVAGQLIGRTKEAIQNLATGRNDSNYDLFNENGEIDLGVLEYLSITRFRCSSKLFSNIKSKPSTIEELTNSLV
jgi:hypothetical protein